MNVIRAACATFSGEQDFDIDQEWLACSVLMTPA